MAKPIEMPFELRTQVDPMKHILDGVHIGATWQIWLNHACAALCPYDKLLWALVDEKLLVFDTYLVGCITCYEQIALWATAAPPGECICY